MDKKENNTEKENLSLHDLLLKQQALLLQQSEYIAKEKQRQKEESDEIDLSRLVPGFLKKKKKSEEKETNATKKVNIDINAPEFDQTKKAVRSTWGFFIAQFDMIMKFRYFIIGIALIGFIYGIITYIKAPKVYRSTMTLASGDFDNTYYANLIAGLQNLAENKSYIGLANKLNLDTVITQNICNIEYQDYLSRYLEELDDSTIGEINRPYFKVTVDVYYNSILPYTEDALLNYLKENKYVNRKLEIKKRILQNSIDAINGQLVSYDSLKNAVIKNIQTMNEPENNRYSLKETGLAGGGIILSQEDRMELKPLDPFDKADVLIREKIVKERELLLLEDNFELVDGLAPNYQPISPRLRGIILYAIYAFVFGILAIYLVQVVKFIFTYKTVKSEQ